MDAQKSGRTLVLRELCGVGVHAPGFVLAKVGVFGEAVPLPLPLAPSAAAPAKTGWWPRFGSGSLRRDQARTMSPSNDVARLSNVPYSREASWRPGRSRSAPA